MSSNIFEVMHSCCKERRKEGGREEEERGRKEEERKKEGMLLMYLFAICHFCRVMKCITTHSHTHCDF